MAVFIKQLNAHELGWRKGVPNKAGHYLLIHKSTISYFPSLSSSTLNDSIDIMINGISSKYIYHNSKWATTDPTENRDEYRLYFDSDLVTVSQPFNPDDIAILKQIGAGTSYTLSYIKTTDPNYSFLLSVLNTHPKSSAKLVPDSVVSGLLPTPTVSPFAGITLRKRTPDAPSEEEIQNSLEEPLQVRETTRRTYESSRIERDSKFSNLVLHAYDYRCAVSDTCILYGTLCNLQAAHIIPKANGGSDNPTNGIALSRDLHWAFDEGLFTIDENYKVIVHPNILEETSCPLNELHGETIRLPEDSRLMPSVEALRWRMNNIFANFLKQ